MKNLSMFILVIVFNVMFAISVKYFGFQVTVGASICFLIADSIVRDLQ